MGQIPSKPFHLEASEDMIGTQTYMGNSQYNHCKVQKVKQMTMELKKAAYDANFNMS